MGAKHTPEPFVLKTYYYDSRPGLEGNGFHSLEIGVPEAPAEAQKFVDYANRLIEERAELLDALQEAYGSPIDLTNAKCHAGITTVEKCARCSRELKARKVIAKATGEKE